MLTLMIKLATQRADNTTPLRTSLLKSRIEIHPKTNHSAWSESGNRSGSFEAPTLHSFLSDRRVLSTRCSAVYFKFDTANDPTQLISLSNFSVIVDWTRLRSSGRKRLTEKQTRRSDEPPLHVLTYKTATTVNRSLSMRERAGESVLRTTLRHHAVFSTYVFL